MEPRFSLLIANEDAGTVSPLAQRLERDGFRVFRAYRGAEAFEIIEKELVHVLVLDMDLSDFSGVQILKTLQEKEKSIPSILTAKEPWKEIQLEAISLGVFAFIQKPIRENILRHSLTKLLDRNFANDPPNFPIQIYQKDKRFH